MSQQPIVLDPDPASTIEASDEYIRAWFAAYGNLPWNPPTQPPPPGPWTPGNYVFPESVLPEYLHENNIEAYIAERVSQAAGTLYTHVQSTPSALWTVQHNLHTFGHPVILLDSAPTTPVWTDTEYQNAETIVLSFPEPVTGRAYITN